MALKRIAGKALFAFTFLILFIGAPMMYLALYPNPTLLITFISGTFILIVPAALLYEERSMRDVLASFLLTIGIVNSFNSFVIFIQNINIMLFAVSLLYGLPFILGGLYLINSYYVKRLFRRRHYDIYNHPRHQRHQ